MKQLFFRLISAVAVVLPAAAAAQTGTTLATGVTLQAGDVARIVVWRNAELSGDFVVGGDGTLIHPLYRTVHVAGVAIPEVESRLRQFLSQFGAQPAFSFAPLIRIFVLGNVRSPAALTVPPGTTISQALALAGGSSDQADQSKVRLVRGEQTIIMNLSSADAAELRTPVQSGDQLIVPAGHSTFRDVVAPTASVLAMLLSVANLFVHPPR